MSTSDDTPVRPKPTRRGESSPRWFGELGEVEFEVDFYERVLARQPNYVIVLRALGELLARKGQYGRSLEIDRRLVALVPHDCVARYNLACSLAMQGSARQAIEELGRAIQYGYDDFGHLEVDPDLESLRTLPAYQELLRQYGIEG
jgi:tetratricopeptide (TPR) repeat protein